MNDSYFDTTTELFGEQQSVAIGYDYDPGSLIEGIGESILIFEVRLSRMEKLGYEREGRQATSYHEVDILPVLNRAQVRLLEEEVLEEIFINWREYHRPAAPGTGKYQEAA
jgi:hypothetical protein